MPGKKKRKRGRPPTIKIEESSPSTSTSKTASFAKDVEQKILRTEEIVLIEDFMVKKRKQEHRRSKSKDGCVVKEEVIIQSTNMDLNEIESDDNQEKDQIKVKEEVCYLTNLLNPDGPVSLLCLNQNQNVALDGYAEIAVLLGVVEINGYQINGSSDPQFYDVFSPTSSSLQYLKDVSPSKPSIEAVKTIRESLNSLLKEEQKTFLETKDAEEITSYILMKKMKTHLPSLLSKLNNYQDVKEIPQVFSQPFELPVLQTDEWRDIICDMDVDISKRKPHECQCSVLLCGGKDVGKSSFCRYIINKMLCKHDAVFYLECDCGQTEFTPPAILSLVKVTKPLLGPPFTHQQKPLKSYFYGHISPQDAPTEYISLIKQLFETYQKEYLNVGPLVINQQGWVRGLGLSLLVDCIRITSPCFTIQIDSTTVESRNLANDLSKDFVDSQSGWSINQDYESIKRSHPCIYLKLKNAKVFDKVNSVKNKSLTSRNIALTAYFSDMFEKHQNLSKPSSLSALTPYRVKWCDVAVHCLHQNISFDLLMYALNMAVVCLAQVVNDIIGPSDENNPHLPLQLLEQPQAEFLGLGIIRNIDPVNHLFYILTPEPLDVVNKVNALIKGNIQLPHTYLVDDENSTQPYYCYDYPSLSSKISSGLKPRFNLKRKPSRLKNSFGERA